MPTAQARKHRQPVRVRLGRADSVEDAHKLVALRTSCGCGLDDVLNEGLLVVVKDGGGAAATAQVEVTRAGNGEDADAGSGGELRGHGADGGGAAVDDEGLFAGRWGGVVGVEGRVGQAEGRGGHVGEGGAGLLDGEGADGGFEGEGDYDAVGEGDGGGEDGGFVCGHDGVQGEGAVLGPAAG